MIKMMIRNGTEQNRQKRGTRVSILFNTEERERERGVGRERKDK